MFHGRTHFFITSETINYQEIIKRIITLIHDHMLSGCNNSYSYCLSFINILRLLFIHSFIRSSFQGQEVNSQILPNLEALFRNLLLN